METCQNDYTSPCWQLGFTTRQRSSFWTFVFFNAECRGFFCASLSFCTALQLSIPSAYDLYGQRHIFQRELVKLFFSTISVQSLPSSKVLPPWPSAQVPRVWTDTLGCSLKTLACWPDYSSISFWKYCASNKIWEQGNFQVVSFQFSLKYGHSGFFFHKTFAKARMRIGSS